MPFQIDINGMPVEPIVGNGPMLCKLDPIADPTTFLPFIKSPKECNVCRPFRRIERVKKPKNRLGRQAFIYEWFSILPRVL